MKVIANIGNDRVLVEIAKNELFSLHGVETMYSQDFDKKWMEIGYEIDLAKMYATMRDLRNLDRSRIGMILTHLENTIDTVKAIKENTEALTLFETLSQTTEGA